MTAPLMPPEARELWAVWLEAAVNMHGGLTQRLPEFAEACRGNADATESLLATLPHNSRDAQRLREVVRHIAKVNRDQEKSYRRLYADFEEAQRLADRLGLGGDG